MAYYWLAALLAGGFGVFRGCRYFLRRRRRVQTLKRLFEEWGQGAPRSESRLFV
jgi:hypothetical protein